MDRHERERRWDETQAMPSKHPSQVFFRWHPAFRGKTVLDVVGQVMQEWQLDQAAYVEAMATLESAQHGFINGLPSQRQLEATLHQLNEKWQFVGGDNWWESDVAMRRYTYLHTCDNKRRLLTVEEYFDQIRRGYVVKQFKAVTGRLPREFDQWLFYPMRERPLFSVVAGGTLTLLLAHSILVD